MTNTQQTDGLTDEQIELLRSLPGWNERPIFITEDEALLADRMRDFCWYDIGGGVIAKRRPAADAMLATLDAQADRIRSEEREVREAAEAQVQELADQYSAYGNNSVSTFTKPERAIWRIVTRELRDLAAAISKTERTEG